MATPEPRDRAFERLYQRYVQDVYRYALAVLRNPADAEDVTQTTFMNAYRAMQRGEDPRKPQHWLIAIAHNACRTRAIRASRRPREVPLDGAVAELAVPEQERPNVRAVLRALGRLPFNQRAALVMRELEGRSYEEIAETLGVTVPAVETLIFRARRSLRLRRDTLLRGLAGVPLPASLQGLFDGGSAATSGGIALGGGALLKAAAVVAAVLAGTAGYEAAGVSSAQHRHAHAPAAAPSAASARLPIELALAPLPARNDAAGAGIAVKAAPGAARLRRTSHTLAARALPHGRSAVEESRGHRIAPPTTAVGRAPAHPVSAAATSPAAPQPVQRRSSRGPRPVRSAVASVRPALPAVPAAPAVTVPAVTVSTPAVPAVPPAAVTVPSVSVPTIP